MYKNSIKRWKWLFIVSWLIAGNSIATVRGIVVGINQYSKIPNGNLDGAVNDARDIVEALKHNGVQFVTTLLDKEATRAAIIDAWQRMLKQSKAGDVLLFSFAGHGIQLPELVRGTEVDGMDEALALTDFQQSPPNEEFLRDDDIATFLKQASDSAIKVLFLADACHSGTMTRGIDTNVRNFKFRALPAITTRGLADTVSDSVADVPANKIAASIEVEKLPGISYIGAVQDFQLAPETIIDGDPRGALSWAASKAIRGNGDVNHDGIITDTEFMNYVRDTVVTRMEGQQQPSLPQKHDIPLLTFNNIPQSNNIKSDAIIASSLPLPIAIINAAIPAPNLIAQIKNTRLVTDNSAILTWNTQRGEILGTLGDVVANVHIEPGLALNPKPCPIPSRTRGFGRQPPTAAAVLPLPIIKSAESKECASNEKDLEAELPRVQLVVDKFTLVETLRAYAERQPMTISIEPEDKIFKDKEPVSITVSGLSYAYFTLFNLSSDGTINFLYPLRTDGYNDPLQIPSDKPYRLDLTVQPPFGADHFVALASALELAQLHTTLTQLNGKAEAAKLLKILKTQLKTTNIQVGIRGVYTGITQ